MLHNISFCHALKGRFRPQIVLVGNGLERNSGQPSWETLVNSITVPDCIKLTEQQKKETPFPLLYEILSSHSPSPHILAKEEIDAEESRLAAAMKQLKHTSNEILDLLPSLDAAIFLPQTTLTVLSGHFTRGAIFQTQLRVRKSALI